MRGEGERGISPFTPRSRFACFLIMKIYRGVCFHCHRRKVSTMKRHNSAFNYSKPMFLCLINSNKTSHLITNASTSTRRRNWLEISCLFFRRHIHQIGEASKINRRNVREFLEKMTRIRVLWLRKRRKRTPRGKIRSNVVEKKEKQRKRVFASHHITLPIALKCGALTLWN